jgi:AMP-polyphosphate phosphotransferase
VSIDITAYERGAPFSGDVGEALTALRDRLATAQLSQIVHRQRAVVVLEGPEGAGKTAVLKQLAAALDPRFFSVCTILPDRRRHSEGHWLARFWAGLPEAGHATFFYHSWYKRVLEDRVLGMVAEKEWSRAYDEINEFEAQQRDYGTLITKLYFHITDEVQDERIAALAADPWRQAMLGPAELRESEARARYREALTQMFDQNHTRWSPWIMIDANDRDTALVSALGAIADAMERALPSAPPQETGSVIDFRTPERA